MTKAAKMLLTTKMEMNKARGLRLAAIAAIAFAWMLPLLPSLPAYALVQKHVQPTERIVEGTVVGDGGQPLSNVVVFLKDEKTLFIKSYLTDAQGHFKFSQLSLSTDYDLWAKKGSTQSKSKHISPFNDKPEIDYTITLK